MGVTMESTLDPTDAAVRKIIKAPKKLGYVTHDQVNAVLSSSDQIEDLFVTLSEMCINVVRNEEAETEEGDDGKSV
jgi:RNA polymerase primary sigma factor